MKTGKNLFVFVLMLLALTVVLTTCELGLGAMVNTEKPKISMPENSDTAPGAFLQGGYNCIELQVDQPFGIDFVYMNVWYTDDATGIETSEPMYLEAHQYPPDPPWCNSEVTGHNHVNGMWYVNLDTAGMADGKIRAQVTAVDVSGNESTTTDIIYQVKNLPPQIELTIPNIKGNDFDKPDLQEWLVGDPVILGFSIMGLATDNLGVKLGYPKIQIWPANLADQYIDYETKLPKITGDPLYDRYAQYYSMVVPENTRDGITTTRFSWPMWQLVLKDKSDPNSGYVLPTTPDDTRSLNPGQYRFRIETRDTNNIPNYYPNRYDNPNYKPEDNPIKFMEISYIAADIPIIMLQEPKPYYNGVGEYVVNLIINSQNTVTDVNAWVTDRDENPSYTSSFYPVQWVSTDGNRYIYKLTLTAADAQDWHNRPNTNLPQLYLNFEAKDERDNKSPTLYRSFLFDVTSPSVQFDRPFANLPELSGGHGTMTGGEFNILYPHNPPRWINGTATVSGSSLDASSGITKLYYHIGKLGDDQMNESQRRAAYENADWIDTNLDSFNPADHTENWSGNVYTWQYTAPFSGAGGYNKITHSALIQEMGELNTLGTHGGAASFQTSGASRFYLPFYVKVVDGAGNFRVVHYKICIDPDLDVPYASINTPAPTLEVPIPIIGGEVRLSGTANDDDWVHSVIVRIKREGSSTWYIPATNPPTLEVYSAGTFPTFAGDPGPRMTYNSVTETWVEGSNETVNESKAGWFRANKLGDDMVIGWFVNINGDGGLDPVPCSHTLSVGEECTICKDFVNVFIEVRAVDTKTHSTSNEPAVVGPSTQLPVIFSAGAPRISNPKITAAGVPDRDYYEGINGSGIFKIQSVISDDKGITNTRVRLNGIDYQIIQNGIVISNNVNAQNAGISMTAPTLNTVTGRVESTLTINIDTKDNAFYTANFGFGRTGYLDLDINVQDNNASPMFARGIYKVGVDNYYPTTSIETQFNASSVKRDETEGIAGYKFELSGIAKDYGGTSGSIQEIARVLIFFQEAEISYSSGEGAIVAKAGGAYLNQRGKKAGEQDTFYNKTDHLSWLAIPAMTSYPNVRTSTQTTTGSGAWGTSISWFPVLEQKLSSDANIGYVWESPHALVIDNAESDMWLDTDKDGTFGEVWSGLVDKTWRAFIDTENFADGPLMVHYFVMDQAGNVTRYQEGIYIENKKPQIKTINFGTNYRGTTSIASWTSQEYHGDFMRDNYIVGATVAGNRIINFDPQFRIRGNQLAIRIETEKGNGTMNYEISHVTPQPRIQAKDMKRGKVYTVETPGTTDWQKLGAPNNTRHTTFVASGPGEGTGYAVPYNVVGTPAKGTFAAGNPNINNVTVFNTTDFGAGTNQIQDSPKVSGAITRRAINLRTNWPSDWEVAWPERLFIVKVYDTTVPGPGIQVEDQLAHAVIVALDVDNTDTLAPGVKVAPFGKKYLDLENEALKTTTINVSNYNENIVMSGDGTAAKKEGYVQYAEHSSDLAAPDVSGQVIFLGKSSDNQRIQNINVTIPGFNGGSGAGTMFTVANYNTTTGKLVSVRETMGTGNNAWYFKITSDHLTLNYGHAVNWEFAWDTSEVSYSAGTPAVAYRQVGNQDVTITVNDYRTTATPVASDFLRVRIVPYISEIVTGLSGAYKSQPSAFARSSTGWYSVRENETITIRGFNLGTNETTQANSITGVRINATDLTYSYNAAPDTALAAGNFRVINKNEVRVNVGATATSGDISVLVGANYANRTGRTSSINNSTRKLLPGQTVDAPNEVNRVSYNWEPNRTNNDILTNDRKLYIWNVANILNVSTEVNDPVMAVNPTGRRAITMTNGTNGAAFRLWDNHAATNTAGTTMGSSVNRHINFGITVDINNNNWYLVSSNMTGSQTNSAFLHARGAPGSLNSSTNTGTNKARILTLGDTNASPNRVLIPKLHSRSDNVTLSYGDGVNGNAIRLHYGAVGATGNANNNGTDQFSGHYRGAANEAYFQTVTDGSSTYRGSQYTASASLSTGQPVIAWFDDRNGQERLLFSYGNQGTYINPGTNGMTTAIWNDRAVIVHGLGAGNNGLNGAGARYATTGAAGAHVDMAVDEGNNIHLAYYDMANGGLYYAHIGTVPNTAAGITTVVKASDITVVKVDTFLAAGTKIQINVRNEGIGTGSNAPTLAQSKFVPYITYFHASFAETRNSIRVAWLATSDAATNGKMVIRAGTDDNDLFLGNWEVMTVPVANVPFSNTFVCNGVPRTVASWAAITNGPAYSDGNNAIHKSIFIGYMTREIYEGAILKRNIWTGP
ncbi:MAG: hypothetical protein FWB77_00340 [Treponema sp.]|nr:hypothetical protein [Treponema sp.]